jgi:acyl-CoA synthetase (AMP-forming)/AMP-acid ligase II
MSFLDTFTDNIRKYPEKIALEFIDPPLQQLTYTELDQLIQQTAGYLHSLGLQRGDRVALQLSKCLEFVLLHLATIRLGAIVLPLNLAYPPDELKYFLEDSGAKSFFALDSAREKLQPVLAQLPELKQCIFLDPTQPTSARDYSTTGMIKIPPLSSTPAAPRGGPRAHRSHTGI